MASASTRRVVITGMGLVSPLGQRPEDLWDALVAGRSGVGPLTQFAADALPTRFGAEARSFTGRIEDFGPLDKAMQRTIKKGLKVMCREIQMGVAAAQGALNDANLDPSRRNPERTGVTFGSDYIITLPEDYVDAIRHCTDAAGQFHFEKWAEDGLPKIDPLWLLKYLPNMPASHVAIYNDLRGPSNSITLREASANLTVGEAYSTIQRDSADAILAGATGTRVHSIRTLHVIMQEDVAREENLPPEQVSRPFDQHRRGMALGEGAGVVVLEELESARARGAKVLAEIIGQGAAMVAQGSDESNWTESLVVVLNKALASAGISPEDVGHIHAHGLSTVTADRAEAQAIARVFGSRPVPVVAAKSHFGNLGAGGGIVELIASVCALSRGHLFPVLNYQTPDPDCPIHVCRSTDVPAGDTFINLNFTPQGQASAVVVRRVSSA